MAKKTPDPKPPALPPGVEEADTKHPDWKANSQPWGTGEYADAPYDLTFYLTDGGGAGILHWFQGGSGTPGAWLVGARTAPGSGIKQT
jgi:hypothetical protein